MKSENDITPPAPSRLPAPPPRGRLVRAAVAVLSVAATSVAPISVPVAEAAIIRPFAIRYQVDANGAIDIFGNTLVTCPAGSAGCAAAQNPTGTNTAANNAFTPMASVDADSDASTTNSSMTTVTLPSGSTVRFAGLYWGARSSSTTRNQLSFRVPGTTTYTTVTADRIVDTSGATDYAAFKNVTTQVQAAGTGQYWAGNIRATTGNNDYGGWALVVVYENPALPLRNLTVFDGYAVVQNTTADRIVDIPLSGFLAPPFGTVNAEVGVVAYEGDGGNTGDQFLLNGVALSDAQNPANDFFNSTISSGGTSDTGRNPGYRNQLGFDADEVSAVGIIPNSATSATVRLTTSGDAYYPSAVTTQIDLYAPSFPEVTKTVVDLNGGTTQIGDTLRYSVTMTNTGLDPARSSVIRDIIPTGTTYVPGSLVINGTTRTDASGDDVGEFNGTRVQAYVGTGATSTGGGVLSPNESGVMQFDVSVNSNYAGQTVSNRATLDYVAQTLNRPFTFSTNTVTTSIDPLADLQIVKTGSPSAMIAGSPATYTITVTNNGPNPSTGVTVTDNLPTGFDSASAAPSQGSCSGATSLSCSLGTLAVGASATVTVTGSIAAGADPNGSLTNTASVTAAVTDPVPGNNSSTITTPIDASADLSIAKTASPSTATAGSPISYTLTVSNAGPSTAQNIQVAEALPAALLSPSLTTSAGGTCAGTTCSFASLAPGATATVTVSGTVSSSAGATLVNSATVSSATPDPSSGNNGAGRTTTINTSANLSITKSASPSPAVPGSSITYTLTVSNAGPSDAAAVAVTDTLPSLTGVTAVATIGSCSGTATVTCSLGTLAAGNTATITITGTVPAGQTSALSNTASVTSPTSDPASGNNTASVTSPVAPSADLSITKTANPNPLIAGQPVTYIVTVTNNGPSNATGVSVTDTPPSALTAVSATASQGTCAGLTCSVGTLAAGATVTVTVTGDVPAGTDVSTVAANTATVTSATSDPSPGDNTASISTGVAAIADLQLTKLASAPTVHAGESVTYTVSVRNAGPSVAGAFEVADLVPAGLTPTTATIGGSPCSISSQTVTCSSAGLAVNATATITIVAAVSDGQSAGAVNNTAAITSQTTSDPTTSNNAGAASVTVTHSADLTLTKAAVTGPITPGSPATWRLTVDNLGPSDAGGSLATDSIPSGWTLSAGSDPRCLLVSGTITCDFGVIPADDPAFTVDLVVVPPPNATTGPITNTASISSATPDPNAANSTGGATATVTAVSDLRIAKIDTPDPVAAGRPISYTITVTNDGPSDSAATSVTDTLPAALTGALLTPSQGTCSGSSCTLGRLAAGASATITVAATVAAGTPVGTITNTAAVISASDPNAANDVATAETTVQRRAEIVLAKSASPATVEAGNRVTWTITASNTGPSVSDPLQISDTLPAAVDPATAVVTTSPAMTCSSAPSIVCDVPSLAVGATASITIEAQIRPDATVSSLINTAGVVPSTSINSDNGPVSATTPVIARADLVLSKNASLPNPVAGNPDGLTWVIQVLNDGPSTARDVEVTDALPAGFTASAISTTVGSCAGAPSLTCDLGDLPIGALVTITVTGTVSASATGALANTATVSASTIDPAPGDESDTARVTVQTIADLSVTKTPATAPFTAGSSESWTITVTNSGPSDALAVVVNDTLPSTGYSGATLTPSQGTCSGASCTLGTIAAGSNVTITVTGTISAGFSAASISNTARASSATADPDPADNTAASTVPVAPIADLSITKIALSPPFTPGTSVQWRIQVVNNGPSNAQAVVVDDALPSGFTLGTVVPSSGTCTITPPAAFSCALGTRNAGTTATITVTATLAAGVTAGSVSNTASVSSTTSDPVPANNTSTGTAATTARADLSVVKAFTAPNPIEAGDTVVWTVAVTNAGPSDAQAVSVADSLPAGLTIDSVVTVAPGCTGGANPGCTALAAGSTATFTYTGTLSPDARGTLTNTATASSTTPDPTPGNNAGTDSDPIAVRSDVVLDKIAPSPAPVPGGGPGRWTITLTNNGPSTANGVAIDDPITGVTGVTLASASTAGACTTAVLCTIGDLPPGATVTVLIDVVYPASAGSATISNTATVTASTALTGTTSDTASFVLTRSADLQIRKSAAPDPVIGGQPASYTIEYTNAGPSDAADVVITDTLPAGVTSPVTPVGCTIAAGVLTCSLGTLAAGSGGTVTLAFTAAGVVDTTNLTNTAAIDSSTADPETGNNSASVAPNTANSADVVLAKSVSAGPYAAGSAAVHTWTITATNSGPSSALATSITDTLPTGVTPGTPGVTAAGGAGTPSCTFTGLALSCTPVTVPAGGSITVTVPFTVDADTPAGPISNAAGVTSTTTDPTFDNNTAAATASVERETAVTITKAASPDPVTAGEAVTWTIDATVVGPSSAEASSISDTVPLGFTPTSAALTVGSVLVPGGCAIAGRLVSCPLGDLAPGATVRVVITADVDPAQALGTVSNTANFSTITPGGGTSATDPLDVGRTSPVTITKTALGTGPYTAGTPLDWQIVVTNPGPSTAESVVVTDPVPSGYSLTGIEATQGVCATTGTPTCLLGAIPVGGSVTLAVRGSVLTTTPAGTMTNIATVDTADSAPLDGSATVTVDRAGRLSLIKTATPTTAVAGEPLTWTVTITNDGPSTSDNVVVTDAVPVALLNPVVTPSSGTWASPAWALPTLAVGATETLTISGRLDPALTSASVTNSATLTSDTTNPGTNSASVTTPVLIEPDMTVVKTTFTDPVIAGQDVTWRIAVDNIGSSDALDVVVTDTLPATVDPGSAAISVDPTTAATCSAVTVSCDFGTFTADQPPATITLTARLLADTPSGTSLDNSATVTTSSPDTTAGNDSSSSSAPVTTRADLAIAKAVSTSPLVAGQPATWRITVTNPGPSDALDLTIVDTPPAVLLSPAAASPDAICSGLTCTLATLPAGQSVTVDVTGTLRSDIADGSTVTNRATVASPSDPATTVPKPASVTTPVTTSADVSVTKTVVTAPVAGQPVAWDIVVTNAGPSDAQAVSVADTVPAVLTNPVLTFTPTVAGGVCTTGGCTITTLAAGTSATIRVIAGVPASVATGTDLANTATVTSTTTDPSAANNTSTAPAAAVTRADLDVTKTGPATVVPGEPIGWTITIRNDGPSDAQNVGATDTLPGDATGVVFTTAFSGATCDATGCTIATIPAGQTVAITVSGSVNASALTQLVNSVAVTSGTTDPDPGDNTASSATDVTPRADVSVTKAAVTAAPVAGTPMTWTITVTNHGSSTARDVVVSDTLPAGFTVTSVSGGGCSALPCTYPTLAPGVTQVITVSGDLAPSLLGAIANSASVSASTTDPDPADNTSIVSSTVADSADVAISKVAGAAEFVAGTPVSWTITITNTGPSDARSVVVADTLPAGLSNITLAPSQGACTSFPCALGTIPDGGSATIAVSARLSAGYTSAAIANTASVTTSASDPTPGNNSSTATTGVVTQADLRLVKLAVGQPFVPGTPASWTITVTNDGPSVAAGVVIADTLPTGATITAATVSGGATCTGVGTANLSCTASTLASGGSIAVDLTAALDADVAPGTLSNTASVSSATTDADPGNNTWTAVATVVGRADLATTKAFTSLIVAGQPVTWTVTVRNAGPSDAADVSIVDVLDSRLTLLTATIPGGTCTGFTTVTCNVAALAAGGSVTVNYSAALDPGARGTLANSATAASATSDPDGADNTGFASSPISVVADIEVAKVAPATPPVPGGGPSRWTITVVNRGPSTADAAVISDTPGAGTVVAAATTVGTCVTSPSISCALGNLAVAAPVTILVDVDYPASLVGIVGNTATATAAGYVTDPDSGDNTSTATIAAAPSADVTIAKTITPNVAVVAGTAATYELTVSNNGPSDATGVVVTDVLPAAATAVVVPAGCTLATSTLTCAIGTLAPGATRLIAVPFTAAAGSVPGDLDNTADVASATADPDAGSNTSTVATGVTAVADLEATKTVSAGPHVAGGGPVTFTLGVTNRGPSDADDVTVSDTFDAAFRLVAPLPSGCAAAGNTVTCSAGTLAPNAGASYAVVVEIRPDAPAGPIVNTATASSSDPDPAPDTNVVSVAVDVERTTAITFAKTAPTSVTAGTPVTWTITGGVDGPSTAEAASVSDTLPAGFTPTGATLTITTTSGTVLTTCTISGQTVSCPLGTLPVGATFELAIASLVDPGQPLGSSDNTASFSTITPGGNTTARRSIEVTRTAPIQIAKQRIGTDPTLAGTALDWTITITNPGPSTATDVHVDDLAPAGYVFSSLEPSQGSCAIATGCDLGTIPVAGSATITVRGTVDPAQPAGTITNTASAAGSEMPGPEGTTAGATIGREASLRFTKLASTVAAVAGEPLTWTLTVTNDGPSTSEGVVVTDVIPAAMPSPSVVASLGSFSGSTWTVGTLAVGGSATLTITGEIDPAYLGTDVVNAATLVSATPNPGQAATSAASAVTQRADLSVRLTAASEVVAGGPITFTIDVTNAGPSNSQGVTVTFPVPAGVTLAALPPGCTLAAGVVTCAVPSIADGATSTITLTGTVAADRTDAIVATVGVGSATADPDPADNTTSLTAQVAAQYDLVITKSVDDTSIAYYATATFTLIVVNSGPSFARDVMVTDVLPAGLTLVSASPGCTGTTTLTCTVGELAPGARATVAITVRGIEPGERTNCAATGGRTQQALTQALVSEADTAIANDRACVALTVEPAAEVTVTKTASVTSAISGDTVAWTVTVRNAGPSAATDVVVTESPSASMTIVSATPSLGSFDVATRRWTIPSLTAGASATLTVRTALAAAGTASNAVSVATATPDAVAARQGRPGQPAVAEASAQVAVAPRLTPPTGSSSRPLAGVAALLVLFGLVAAGGARRRSAPGQ